MIPLSMTACVRYPPALSYYLRVADRWQRKDERQCGSVHAHRDLSRPQPHDVDAEHQLDGRREPHHGHEEDGPGDDGPEAGREGKREGR